MGNINIVYDKAIMDANRYVLDERSDNYRFDFYSCQMFPVNFDVRYATFDFHLPLENLLKKYHPELSILHMEVRHLKKEDKFVYPVNFIYLYNYLKQYTVPEMIDHLAPEIKNGLLAGNGIVVLNDSHEYASYINLKGFSYVNVLHSFKGLEDTLYNKFFISSSNLDNESYKGTVYSGDNSSLPQKIKNHLLNFIYARNKDPNIRVFGFRYFEEVVSAQAKLFYPEYDFNIKRKSLEEGNVRHFICLNNINKDFRSVICCKIQEYGLAGKFFLSHKKMERGTYGKEFYKKWNKLIDQKTFAGFESSLPLNVDAGASILNPWNLVPWDLVNKSFCWLVTETLYDGDIYSRGFFTEKIYKPMSIFMPFLLVAQPYSLYNLQQEGYATFGKWWDESYDTELDPVKRMEMILANLVSLSKLDQQGLVRMYKDMEEVLRHNYDRLLNTTAAEKYIKNLVHTYNSL